MKTLVIKKIVSGTATNIEAFPLYLEMKSCAEKSDPMTLSFKDVEFTSSSFLNSSIGAFIDYFGFENFSKGIKFTDCTPEVASFIKGYVKKYCSLSISKK